MRTTRPTSLPDNTQDSGAAKRSGPQESASRILFSELLRQRKPLLRPAAEAGRVDVGEVPVNAEKKTTPRLPPPPSPRLRDQSHDRANPDTSLELAVVASAQPAVTALVDERWRHVASDVAHTVAAFCNEPAASGPEGWQIQMQLRADVVADTTLCVTLSPHWLTLRFDTRDPASHNLLSQGQHELVGILQSTLVRQREIAISFGSK
jgi:type III secretion control protein HpaP